MICPTQPTNLRKQMNPLPCLLAPRSGLAVKNFIDTGAGVVDYDYRGNVGVVLFNHGDEDFAVSRGDRVAQLILERISMAGAEEVEELSDTARGAGGFGSTGVQGAVEVQEGEAVKRPRTEGPAEQAAKREEEEVVRVKKLTDLATIPVRGSMHAAGKLFVASPLFPPRVSQIHTHTHHTSRL